MKSPCALLSVDNTQGFENAALDELYVPNGERVAQETVRVANIVKQAGGLLYHLFDNHPIGHVSFAENYLGKKPFDSITYEEIKEWTEENNGLAPSASFSVEQLKSYLQAKPDHKETVRPTHCVKNTQGSTLMPPLDTIQFDRAIPKGDSPNGRDYSGFSTGALDKQLQEDAIKTVIITGVATDYCVGQTALDAVAHNYTTYVIRDAVQGVAPDTTEAMKHACQTVGIKFITTDELATLLLSV